MLVALRTSATNREHIVQQQHTLSCPSTEVAMQTGRYAQIGLEFFVDVLQGGWERLQIGFYTEAQSIGLTRTVVGVLPKNDDPDGIPGCVVESREYFGPGWIDRVLLFFFKKCSPDVGQRLLPEELFQPDLPALFHL